MHLRQLNHVRLGVVLRPRGPILIKSGIETPDPTRPGMEFVRTRHADLGETVYLPGSSLKGALRSHTERVFQGLGISVCDPFDRHGGCRNASGDSPQVFQLQCPACRTFGSLRVSGRFTVLDAYPWRLDAGITAQDEAMQRANATEGRWQVGINRQSGQAQGGALFDLEVVVGGEFHTEIHLHNFQLWQLALTAAVLREMSEGHVPIGFGKFRGLGQVSADIESLRMTMNGKRPELCGVAEFCDEADRFAYGLESGDAVGLPESQDMPESQDFKSKSTWRGTEISLAGDPLGETLNSMIDGPLKRYVENRQPVGATENGP